jgi:Holliday junction resolvasome RuvABC endonuclease subunit
MLVLAVDAGFSNTGYALLDGAGGIVELRVIRTKATGKVHSVRKMDDDGERCKYIAAELAKLFKDGTSAIRPVRAVVCEFPTGGALSARALRCMALVTGVIVAVTECYGVPLVPVAPDQTKRLTGRLNASKQEIQSLVENHWPELRSRPDWFRMPACEKEHVADALGAYLAAQKDPLLRFIRAEEKRPPRESMSMIGPAFALGQEPHE